MILSSIPGALSRIQSLPLLGLLAPSGNHRPCRSEIDGFARAQSLALRAAREVAELVEEGQSEIQIAQLLDTALQDRGVKSFFHRSFVWFGERSRFDGMRTYFDFMPSQRRIAAGEVFILDVAPIVDGYICDIGVTLSLGPNPALARAQEALSSLREQIPKLFFSLASGGAIWDEVFRQVEVAGYDNVHPQYPASVLGHRVFRASEDFPQIGAMRFGWQSYWSLLARGVLGQILTRNYHGDLTGLWAIEPHIGTRSETMPGSRERFGAKFEEILVVEPEHAYWLSEATQRAHP